MDKLLFLSSLIQNWQQILSTVIALHECQLQVFLNVCLSDNNEYIYLECPQDVFMLIINIVNDLKMYNGINQE